MSDMPFNAAQHQASTLSLPPGPWVTVLDCLCAHFAAVSREQWLDRISRGRVLDALGQPIPVDLAYRQGLRIHYFREVPNEKAIPLEEQVLHIDEHLVVADKPHFLPVTPTGEYVEHTRCAGSSGASTIPTWCRCTASTGIPPGWCCSPQTPPHAPPTSRCFLRGVSTSTTKLSPAPCRSMNFPDPLQPLGARRAVLSHARSGGGQ